MYVLGCPIVIRGDLRFADCVLVDTDVSQLMFERERERERVCVCVRVCPQMCTPVLLMSRITIMHIIVFLPDYKGTVQPLAFIQYGFDRKEHAIDIKPHGKSKKQLSFKRTKPSTLKLVKKAVKENKRPLRVLREVENIQGGEMSAKSGCNLP